jgi:hypothetical protein
MASTPGFLARQAGGLMRARTLVAGTNISVSNTTGAADPTIDLTGVIATANGGTSVDIASAALPLGSGQITFPATQNPSAGANVLDDYEEGTWTPVLAGAGGTSGQTYTIQSGHYVKIGQLVTVDCVVLTSVLGTLTGNVIITGLPFTSLNSGYLRTPCTINWFALTTNIIVMQGTIVENSAQLDIFISTAATNSLATNPVQADMANGNAVSFCVSYRANA